MIRTLFLISIVAGLRVSNLICAQTPPSSTEMPMTGMKPDRTVADKTSRQMIREQPAPGYGERTVMPQAGSPLGEGYMIGMLHALPLKADISHLIRFGPEAHRRDNQLPSYWLSAAASKSTFPNGVARLLAFAEELHIRHDWLVGMVRPPMRNVCFVIGNTNH